MLNNKNNLISLMIHSNEKETCKLLSLAYKEKLKLPTVMKKQQTCNISHSVMKTSPSKLWMTALIVSTITYDLLLNVFCFLQSTKPKVHTFLQFSIDRSYARSPVLSHSSTFPIYVSTPCKNKLKFFL